MWTHFGCPRIWHISNLMFLMHCICSCIRVPCSVYSLVISTSPPRGCKVLWWTWLCVHSHISETTFETSWNFLYMLPVAAAQSSSDDTTTVLQPFFRDHPGEPVPEENFWTLWCKADTQTIRLGSTPSGLTIAHLHHPPIFLQARCPSCCPINSVKALKASSSDNAVYYVLPVLWVMSFSHNGPNTDTGWESVM